MQQETFELGLGMVLQQQQKKQQHDTDRSNMTLIAAT